MKSKNFLDRPEFLKTGYTFRNGGGEGDFVFTLLEDIVSTEEPIEQESNDKVQN